MAVAVSGVVLRFRKSSSCRDDEDEDSSGVITINGNNLLLRGVEKGKREEEEK